jgi:hypothetical protein
VRRATSLVSLSPQNSTTIKNWFIIFTGGQCFGQYRPLTNIALGSVGETVTFTPLNKTDGSTSRGPYGTDLWTSWQGCDAPDNTSRYILVPKSAAPGSMTGSTFAVRWGGYVKPTLASVYTFRAFLSGTASNAERVKVRITVQKKKRLATDSVYYLQLWIDTALVIDQWQSISSFRPAGTFKFPDDNTLHHVQCEYKRPAQSSVPPSIQIQVRNEYQSLFQNFVLTAYHETNVILCWGGWRGEQWMKAQPGVLSLALPSSRLLPVLSLISDTDLSVLPASTCSAQSTANGQGLLQSALISTCSVLITWYLQGQELLYPQQAVLLNLLLQLETPFTMIGVLMKTLGIFH